MPTPLAWSNVSAFGHGTYSSSTDRVGRQRLAKVWLHWFCEPLRQICHVSGNADSRSTKPSLDCKAPLSIVSDRTPDNEWDAEAMKQELRLRRLAKATSRADWPVAGA